MTSSNEVQCYLRRSNCGLAHMTRMVTPSWVLLKWFQLVVCLVCTALPTVYGQDCELRRSPDSRFLQASYREEEVLDAGCQTNRHGLLQQTHVLNYKTMHSGPSPANLLVNIDSQNERIQTKTLVLVLNSNVSVEWEVELQSPAADLDVSRFIFVISRTSSLHFASQSKVYNVNNSTSPPVDDQELLSWVRNHYGNITSYSAFHDVDEVTMALNTATSSPSVCDLTSHQSPSKAYTLQDQEFFGCATERYDVNNRRQIHVIELLSPKKNIEDNSMEQVEVNIQKGENSEEGPVDTLLILVSQSSTLWKIRSPVIDGDLSIISNTQVDSASSSFSIINMRIIKNIVATKKGLLQWVEQKYGLVSSFSNVRVANQFQVYLAGPVPAIPTTSLDITTVMEVANPSERTELANNISISCQAPVINVVVPSNLVDKYNLQPEAVTWRNKSCSGSFTDDGLLLRSGFSTCGSSFSENSEGSLIVTNEITFYSSPSSEGSGMVPLSDDEDTVKILAQRIVTCECDVNDIPTLNLGPVPDPLAPGVALYLDLYTDIEFAVRQTVKPYRVEIGDPIFFEMGVTEDSRLNIVMGECWIGIPQAKLFEERLSSLTEDGCPVESSLQYLPVEFQSYQTKMSPGAVKRFTFNVPDINDVFMTFYVFCNLSLCTTAPLQGYDRIVMCSSLPNENAPCSDWKQLKLWPMKNVEMGPFRINSREQRHFNITGALDGNCLKKAGTLAVSSPILAVIIFIAFCIGVLLISSIWLITKYTRVPSSGSPVNSPVGNGHIPNGHVPNGGAHFEMEPFMQNGVNPNNIPHEGLYDGFGDLQA